MRRLLLAMIIVPFACGDDEGSTSTTADADETAAGTESGDSADTGAPAVPGSFSFLTYNVAALPQALSGADPERYIPQISPLLNGYDLVIVQEDFWYHENLATSATHPFQSDPWTTMPSYEDMGDGLNRFSQSEFDMHDRTGWPGCNGITDCSSDCLATKGWSFARHQVDEGVVIDVYNLHMEAGGCDEDEVIRSDSADELIVAMEELSDGRAIIMAGDFNLHEEDTVDLEVYQRIIDAAGLTDACWSLSCGSTSIDRILFRGNGSIELSVSDWAQPGEFVDADDGSHLSDHRPTAVTVHYGPPA